MSESKKTINQKSVEQVEQERLTRRAALRKLGFGAGLSAFMLLGVDDLARMVGTKMAQMGTDNKVAGQIAKEFQAAGVALANASASGSPCSGCVTPDKCLPLLTLYQYCKPCCDGCSCVQPADIPCHDIINPTNMPPYAGYADCQDCCRVRNPNDAVGYGYCLLASQCV